MNVIAWIILGIVGFNVIVIGTMWLIWMKERRKAREKRETGGRDRRPADGGGR